jgi:hypothetical protein
LELAYETEQTDHPEFVRLCHQRTGFEILDAMQGDLDHVLGHAFDQQRDWANTPEDRALASRLGAILQDPVPGRLWPWR